jgi:hypothetical protein
MSNQLLNIVDSRYISFLNTVTVTIKVSKNYANLAKRKLVLFHCGYVNTNPKIPIDLALEDHSNEYGKWASINIHTSQQTADHITIVIKQAEIKFMDMYFRNLTLLDSEWMKHVDY